MGRQSLFEILDHLATHRRKLVLVQGRSYWRIEDLFAQAKADSKKDALKDAVLDKAYTWSEDGGKVSIRRGADTIFSEAGSQQ